MNVDDIRKRIREVKDWHRQELNALNAEKARRFAEVRQDCEHDFTKWELHATEMIRGFSEEYRRECLTCGKLVVTATLPEGLDYEPKERVHMNPW